MLVVTQRFTDHAGNLVVKQLYIERKPKLCEITVVAQFARAHALLVQVAGAAGADEIAGAVMAEGAGAQAVDPVAPIDVVFEHIG
ncbi:hypothetical protein D3C76_949630 [compost metagenome]